MGRLNVPLEVLIVTTRILPSAPGWTSLMTAVGQWSGVVLFSLRISRFSKLDVVGRAMPALAMLQLMEIVSRPPFPEVLELLLECLPPGQSTHFDV